MTPRTAIALLALAGLTFAACGSDDATTEANPVGETASALSAGDLDGRTFVSTDVTGYDLVEGSAINLTFLANALSVDAGCNSLNGGFILDEGTITAEVLASTMMACDDPLMDQDTWLSDFLVSIPTITLDASVLTLSNSEATITLGEVDASELVDTVWNVTGIVAAEAVSTVPAGSEASITIAPDGTVAVNAGCNTGSTTVEITNDTLTFGDIALTKMTCPPEQTELETAVLAALQGEVRYEINTNGLSLRSGADANEIGLDLTAAP
jgi:heat shock protein HslJ